VNHKRLENRHPLVASVWPSAIILCALVFAALGVTFLFRGFAATSNVTAEAETGVISGKANEVSDEAASAGKAVKFGSVGTVPSGVVKIMPFGSSTIVGKPESEGGFRPKLYQLLTADGLNRDFVGSQSSGPSSLPDKNHEGHSGWTIGADNEQLSKEVVGWLNTYNPDIMIFYAGTNDIIAGKSATETTVRLDNIANKIFTQSPNIRLIVGTIIIPQLSGRVDKTKQDYAREYNTSMETVAAKYRGQGKYMQVVNISGAVGPGDYLDDLHANASGNSKMADVWAAGIRATYPTF
jgi:lysophospholipase L1-like esterase